jgi:hypothetical protein
VKNALAVVAVGLLLPSFPAPHAETDLDALMRQVLARRDDNWKKLQQYVLDEREQIEIRGPSHAPIWGERREYTWFVREGHFVRSPVKINGAQLSEGDRQKYEVEFLRRSKERDSRVSRPPTPGGDSLPEPAESSVDGLLRQVREPQFVSSAYFLRFKFEEDRYALVGRETLDGRETLRIEYFPSNLFSERQRRRLARSHDRNDPRDAEVLRLINKVALVTLWVEPTSQQVVKYTFDNLDLDFLPGQWLVRLDSVRASMTMSQPFPDVWLPRDLDVSIAADMAAGRFDVRWSVAYDNYRQPEVKTKVDVGPAR